MVRWQIFADRHPELARRGALRLFEFGGGLAFLSTPRPQGEPLLQPVFPLISGGRMFVLRTPTNIRRRFVESREAYALEAFPLAGRDMGSFYLTGRCVLVGSPAKQSELARQVRHLGRPDGAVFELLIEWALFSGWDRPQEGELRAVRLQWHAAYSAPVER